MKRERIWEFSIEFLGRKFNKFGLGGGETKGTKIRGSGN